MIVVPKAGPESLNIKDRSITHIKQMNMDDQINFQLRLGHANLANETSITSSNKYV